jgi:hypothetical protein
MLNGASTRSWAERQARFERDGGEQNDPDITQLGRWLRKSNVDEIPQLFQIAFGTKLRLFGPRAVQADVVNLMWDLSVGDPRLKHLFERWLDGYYPALISSSNARGSKDNMARILHELIDMQRRYSIHHGVSNLATLSAHLSGTLIGRLSKNTTQRKETPLQEVV